MDKYSEYYDKIETSQEESDLILHNKLNILKNILIKYNITVNEPKDEDSFFLILLAFYKLPLIAQNEIRLAFNKHFNARGLIKAFITLITSFLNDDSIQIADQLIKSFKALSLVKDCKIIKNNKIIIITTNEDQEIKVEVLKPNDTYYNNRCFDIVDNYLNTSKENFDVLGVIQKTFINTNCLHTIIINNGYVEDFSQHIKIKLSDYMKLFKYEIVFLENKNEVIKNINALNYQDADFRNGYGQNICKYLIKKHMEKHEEKQ